MASAELIRFGKIAGKILESCDKSKILQAASIVKMFEEVLGFDFNANEAKQSQSSNDEKLLDLISDIREKLRASKNYELSDYVRDELSKLNISISDKKI